MFRSAFGFLLSPALLLVGPAALLFYLYHRGVLPNEVAPWTVAKVVEGRAGQRSTRTRGHASIRARPRSPTYTWSPCP